MATFEQILHEAEITRHKIYFLQDEKGEKYFAKKVTNSKVSPENLQVAERQNRVIRIAERVQQIGGMSQCEADSVDLATLIEAPKYISMRV